MLFPTTKEKQAIKLGWEDVGIAHDHGGYVEDGAYVASDVYLSSFRPLRGIYPVLAHRGSEIEVEEWHLHQDIVLTLDLRREVDRWVRTVDDYAVCAKLLRGSDGSPCLLEINSLYLKDYMCARGMGLLVTSFRLREAIVEDASFIGWTEDDVYSKGSLERWEGHIDSIHEGGSSFGSETLVIHSNRTDIEVDEDVPVLGIPTDENIDWSSHTVRSGGRKLYRVSGRLWKNSWIGPGEASPIVRRDRIESNVSFIVDAHGKRRRAIDLQDSGQWLWFTPDLITDVADRRGGALGWYTRDTGWVRASPNQRVHFGINSLGLITAYAKDVAWLPEWQLRLWAGHNVPPDGGVGEEMHASQVLAKPAATQAPEAFLKSGLVLLNEASVVTYGQEILRQHDDVSEIVGRCHRFRATHPNGLLELAKDLARITVDSFDTKRIQALTHPAPDAKLGSLKSLELLLASLTAPAVARELLSPLHGVYNLRLGDAHLASSDIDAAYALLAIDRSLPPVVQGYILLARCVGCIYSLCKAINPAQFDTQTDD